MSSITRVHAREVLDSRGKPTVEVEVSSKAGGFGRAIVPSGASTGSFEAVELRDGDEQWYGGQGVRRAVGNVVDSLGPAVMGLDVNDQGVVDRRLLDVDGSPQKGHLGANAILGLSLAAAHCAASEKKCCLYEHLHGLYGGQAGSVADPRMPLPMTNMISGGLHAGGNLDFQDVLAIPVGAPDYRTGLEWLVRVYRRLGDQLRADGYEGRLVGDEGGFGPRLPSNRDAVAQVTKAMRAAGLDPGKDMTIAIDVAASHFYRDGAYFLAAEAGTALSSSQMIDRLEGWIDEYPIVSIEDGLAEGDWDGWRELTRRLGARVQLVGDDLFTTNPERIRHGIKTGVANSVLIKLNQIGTLTETLEAIRVARSAEYAIVVSARSGETEDTTIADLSVAVAADYIKIGSIVRSERLAKYNQLLRIAERFEQGRAGVGRREGD